MRGVNAMIRELNHITRVGKKTNIIDKRKYSYIE